MTPLDSDLWHRILKSISCAYEMAQWVGGFCHQVWRSEFDPWERENPTCKLSSDFHTCTIAYDGQTYVYPHTHTQWKHCLKVCMAYKKSPPFRIDSAFFSSPCPYKGFGYQHTDRWSEVCLHIYWLWKTPPRKVRGRGSVTNRSCCQAMPWTFCSLLWYPRYRTPPVVTDSSDCVMG